MSLKQDLDTINRATQRLLADCNDALGVHTSPAATLSEVPQRMNDLYGAGYDAGMGEGIEVGHANGIEDGKQEATETLTETVLTDCNAVITEYLPAAETLDELPAKIGDMYGYGYTTGNDDGFAMGQQIGWDSGVEKGKQEAYDAFWDAYQQNGNRLSYLSGFSGHGWTDSTFQPKYTMTPTRAGSMFAYSRILDVRGALERQEVTLDTSRSTSLGSIFQECSVQIVPTISTVSCTVLANLFAHSASLRTVECIILRETGDQTFSNAFLNCSALEEIRFAGIIGTNISFAQSANLSRTSIESVMTALSDTVTGQTVIFSKAAVEAAFETVGGAADGSTSEEWKDLVASKPNWSIVLAE